jgi:hypothetical protein
MLDFLVALQSSSNALAAVWTKDSFRYQGGPALRTMTRLGGRRRILSGFLGFGGYWLGGRFW